MPFQSQLDSRIWNTMQYVKLGNTGADISKICLGCMTYGHSQGGAIQWPWSLSEEESRPFIKAAIENGVNFFDTANVYSQGESEKVLGKTLREFGNRDELIVATKVYQPVFDGPNGKGLSRKAIFQEMDKSLQRLGMDYVDLYIIHRFDYGTPLEETLEALNDLVRAGKTRYIGASSMHAWQFMKALGLQTQYGWARFVSMQNHYNLLYREEEREMLPLCLSEGIAVTPWSPLARGRLTRPWGEDSGTERAKTDGYARRLYNSAATIDKPVIDALADLSRQRGISMAQLALAWVMQNPSVDAPLVGVTKMRHLEDACAAIDIRLTEEEIKQLEEPYLPHPPRAAFT
jgi:aryl-alcohol dehydrogenase-like predicted oxidoreductase